MEAVAAQLERAFETRIRHEEVRFFGVEGSSTRVFQSDADVQRFAGGAESEEGHMLLIRAAVPEDVASKLRQPRRLAVLASGEQIAKYLVEAGDVEFALHFFKCGHFRLKEAAAGQALAPLSRGVVVEGTWEEQDTGVNLTFLFSCTCPTPRRYQEEDFLYEALPVETQDSVLEFRGGEGEKAGELLKGTLPSSLTGAQEALVELRRCEDVMPSQRGHRSLDDDAWDRRGSRNARPKRHWEEDWESDEPTWPMYLGICLFIVIILVFAWVWYEETYSPEASREFDEL